MHGRVAHFSTSIVYRATAPAYVILYAAGFVGLGILVVSRIRGRRGRLQPGHWMLVVEASLYAAPAHSRHRIAADEHDPAGRPVPTPVLVHVFTWIPLLAACLCRAALVFLGKPSDDRRPAMEGVICLSRRSWPSSWPYGRLCLGSSSLGAGLECFGWSHAFQSPSTPFSALTLLVVILLDVRVPRDWLHWLGIAAVGGGAALSFCGAFARHFMGSDVTGPLGDRFTLDVSHETGNSGAIGRSTWN